VPKLNELVFVEFCSFPHTSESGRQLHVQFKHRLVIEITLHLRRTSACSVDLISTYIN